MSRILIPYVTGEGQTRKIAEYVAEVVRSRGHEAETVDVKAVPGTGPGSCDGVILGASIHMGQHDRAAVEYVREHLVSLERVPSAFFSVSLAAHGDEHEAEGYVEEFEKDTGWQPGKVALFSGALPYTRYGFVKRHLMKKIVGDKPGGLGTDITRDYVYTEWDGVRRFAEDFLDQVEAGSGQTPQEGSAPA